MALTFVTEQGRGYDMLTEIDVSDLREEKWNLIALYPLCLQTA